MAPKIDQYMRSSNTLRFDSIGKTMTGLKDHYEKPVPQPEPEQDEQR